VTLDERDRLSAQFEASRPRLRALGYRMLGSVEEAEDVVQETWLRVGRAGADDVENLGGWLTTIAARICLDRLRWRRARPEDPSGIHPPERPATWAAGPDPEQEAVLADSVGSAMLVVLDLLAPAERVAFVLHDVFGVPFDEIGGIVGRSPDAARQLASRARRRVGGTTASGELDLVRRREIVDAFLTAARCGDFDALLSVLDPDVVVRPDAAAVRRGARRATRGASAVVELMGRGARGVRLALVGGVAGLAWMPTGRIRGAIEFTIVDDRIVALDLIGDPERLARLDVVVLES
jgi:RNA polymerase sigma factor (sigma-70 family)